jgi:hypothetical protein
MGEFVGKLKATIRRFEMAKEAGDELERIEAASLILEQFFELETESLSAKVADLEALAGLEMPLQTEQLFKTKIEFLKHRIDRLEKVIKKPTTEAK